MDRLLERLRTEPGAKMLAFGAVVGVMLLAFAFTRGGDRPPLGAASVQPEQIIAAQTAPADVPTTAPADETATASLVRNAASAIEAAYVDSQSYAELTPQAVQAVEPSIRFTSGPRASAAANEVAVTFTENGYLVQSKADSGLTFALAKDTRAAPQVTRTCGPACIW